MGRKTEKKTRDAVGLRLSQVETARVDELAKMLGTTRSGAIRQILADYFKALGKVKMGTWQPVVEAEETEQEEELSSVSFKLAASDLTRIDELAESMGMTRSEFLRSRVTDTLRCDPVGVAFLEMVKALGLHYNIGEHLLRMNVNGELKDVLKIKEDGRYEFCQDETD